VKALLAAGCGGRSNFLEKPLDTILSREGESASHFGKTLPDTEHFARISVPIELDGASIFRVVLAMSKHQPPDEILAERATCGDEQALAELFDRHRYRLRQMVKLRLDRRLQGRVDPSDVLQEAFLDLASELPSYSQKQAIPIFLWMRLVAGQRLMRVHRLHLGAEMRDARRDISLCRGGIPQATSQLLAAQLIGRCTSAAGAAIRAEIQLQLQEALDSMDDVDREIIALRHFEELDNCEAAAVLELSPDTARKRYVRALKRLQKILCQYPGLVDR
jgi:RNA polymerase sigma-70 factor, ECF subfamily